MNKSEIEINHVSDTALWVAAYRAFESSRRDALFKDEFAKLLIGDHGARLATYTQGSRYTAWSVVIRTLIIDQFILELLARKAAKPDAKYAPIDSVINLGAGLDTRPYRMNLPKDLHWIEIDFPEIIKNKNDQLKDVMPNCQLKRISADLTSLPERNQIYKELSQGFKNSIILTEGVIPYLSNNEADTLARELFNFDFVNYWITEYYSPEILTFLRTPKRLKQMENAPFKFYPEDWFLFFKERGWEQVKTLYFAAESKKYGRTPPTPGWLKNSGLSNQDVVEKTKNYLGYTIYQKR